MISPHVLLHMLDFCFVGMLVTSFNALIRLLSDIANRNQDLEIDQGGPS